MNELGGRETVLPTSEVGEQCMYVRIMHHRLGERSSFFNRVGYISAEKHNQAPKPVAVALGLFRWSSLLVKDQKAWSGLHANTIVLEVNGLGIIGQLPTITVTPTNLARVPSPIHTLASVT